MKLEKHGRRDKEKRERGRVDRKNLGKRDALLIVWRTIKREKEREKETIYLRSRMRKDKCSKSTESSLENT